jgi:hypothetical protein
VGKSGSGPWSGSDVGAVREVGQRPMRDRVGMSCVFYCCLWVRSLSVVRAVHCPGPVRSCPVSSGGPGSTAGHHVLPARGVRRDVQEGAEGGAVDRVAGGRAVRLGRGGRGGGGAHGGISISVTVQFCL